MAVKPRAKGGLLTASHSKKGLQFVTAFDPDSMQVTLLEPWEHAVLVLCDGTHRLETIARRLSNGVGAEPVDLYAVRQAVVRFREAGLLLQGDDDGKSAKLGAPSPRTLAQLQQAYREWHNDSLKTGQLLMGVTPFLQPEGVTAGLDPTVALPDDVEADRQTSVAVGTTLVLGDSADAFQVEGPSLTSILSEETSPRPSRIVERRGSHPEDPDDGSSGVFEGADLQNVSDLLRAVDHEFAWLDDVEGPPEPQRQEEEVIAPIPPAPMPRLDSSILSLPLDDLAKRQVEVVGLPTTEAELVEAPPTVRSRRISEAGLTPTMVGVPADDGRTEPVFLAPPRASAPPSRREDEVCTEASSRNRSVESAQNAQDGEDS